mmetsp:Transcript_88318/g.201977  ORF Transcript_88318/g.201977 Transcript_88318/m.201977 type:complete len:263 (+) Transcript_88318:1884-2672(+)
MSPRWRRSLSRCGSGVEGRTQSAKQRGATRWIAGFVSVCSFAFFFFSIGQWRSWLLSPLVVGGTADGRAVLGAGRCWARGGAGRSAAVFAAPPLLLPGVRRLGVVQCSFWSRSAAGPGAPGGAREPPTARKSQPTKPVAPPIAARPVPTHPLVLEGGCTTGLGKSLAGAVVPRGSAAAAQDQGRAQTGLAAARAWYRCRRRRPHELDRSGGLAVAEGDTLRPGACAAAVIGLQAPSECFSLCAGLPRGAGRPISPGEPAGGV